MWTTKRENSRGVRIMTALDIAQLVFIVTVFLVGIVGFIKAVNSKDD
jgi:hypothetical protein